MSSALLEDDISINLLFNTIFPDSLLIFSIQNIRIRVNFVFKKGFGDTNKLFLIIKYFTDIFIQNLGEKHVSISIRFTHPIRFSEEIISFTKV